MFIYANGDSHIAGSELGDFLLPGYPGPRDFGSEPTTYTKHWVNQLYTPPSNEMAAIPGLRKKRDELRNKISFEEKTKNLIHKTSQLLGVEYYNNALGGSGNTRIIRTSIVDLIELKKTKKNINAVISLSDSMRLELPSPVPSSNWLHLQAHNLNAFKDLFKEGSPESAVIKHYVMCTTAYNKLIWLYMNIIALQDFCTANGIKLHWVCSINNPVEILRSDPCLKHDEELLTLASYANFNPIIKMHHIARKIKVNTINPGFHYSEIVHQIAAMSLAAILR